MGIGGAAVQPTTLAVITNVFPPRERGRAIGVWAGTAGIAVAGGPLAGGARPGALLVGRGLPHRRPGRRPRDRGGPGVRPGVARPLSGQARRPRGPAVDRRAGRAGLRDHPRRLGRRLDDARRARAARRRNPAARTLHLAAAPLDAPRARRQPLPQPGLLGRRRGAGAELLRPARRHVLPRLLPAGRPRLHAAAERCRAHPGRPRHGADGAAQLRSGRALRRQGRVRHRLRAHRAQLPRRATARSALRRCGCSSSSCRCRAWAWAR